MDADQRARLISQGIDPDTYVEPTAAPTAAHVQTLTDALASLQQLIQPSNLNPAPVVAPASTASTPASVMGSIAGTNLRDLVSGVGTSDLPAPPVVDTSYRPVDQVYAPPASVAQLLLPEPLPPAAPLAPLVDVTPAPAPEAPKALEAPIYYALETPYPVKPAEAPVAPEVPIGDNTPSPFPLATNAVETPAALDTMVGGTHYTDMAFQPLQFILANHLGFVEGNVIKYVCRWQAKGGIEDLKKAQDYLSKLVAHVESAQ